MFSQGPGPLRLGKAKWHTLDTAMRYTVPFLFVCVLHSRCFVTPCVFLEKGLVHQGKDWIPQPGGVRASGNEATGPWPRVVAGRPEESSQGWRVHLCRGIPGFRWSGEVRLLGGRGNDLLGIRWHRRSEKKNRLLKASVGFSARLLRFSVTDLTHLSHWKPSVRTSQRELLSCKKLSDPLRQRLTCFVMWNRFHSPGQCGRNPLLYVPPVYPKLNTEVNAVVSHINNPADFYIQLVPHTSLK